MIQVKNDLRIAKRIDILTVNRILNHRDVRPTIGLPLGEEADVSETFSNFTFFLFSRSLFMLDGIDEWSAEVHTAVVPEDRGKCAIDAAMQAIGILFLSSSLETLYTKNKADQREATFFALKCGFHKIAEADGWVYWALGLADWMVRRDMKQILPLAQTSGQTAKIAVFGKRLAYFFRDAGGDRELGKQFHADLNELMPEDKHEDDDAHNVAVGRCVRTGILNGDLARAETEYNEWARGAGYAEIHLVTELVDGGARIDIGVAIVDVDSNGHVVAAIPQQERTCP